MSQKLIQTSLKNWYLENKRALPWRQSQDPYLIWISEVMLQQTTVQAVIPYFLRFKEKFPTVKALASAPLEEVLEYWAGLGYYSRARNLHKAAQEIVRLGGFPTSYQELLKLPGFGDYTSRAVSSIAFEEPVGVVDGNVIRILSRLKGRAFMWWKCEEKKELQDLADALCAGDNSAIINQAMMELGATLCTPTSPACSLCPWLTFCEANKKKLINELPIKKAKRESEYIAIEMQMLFHKGSKNAAAETLALIENTELPFLKNMLLPPLTIKKLKAKPKQFHFQHSITHYKIYVTTQTKVISRQSPEFEWHEVTKISKVNPSSLLKKALTFKS